MPDADLLPELATQRLIARLCELERRNIESDQNAGLLELEGRHIAAELWERGEWSAWDLLEPEARESA